MKTMKDLREFVALHPHVSDDCVLYAAESDPTDLFDNSGFPITRMAHDGPGDPSDPGDLGLVYLLADGIEHKPTILEKPLTLAEARKAMDEQGQVRVIIAVGLDELIDHDIEGINDLAEERIVENGILGDIGYRVIGHQSATDNGSGEVLIEVTAEVDLSLYEDFGHSPATS